MGVPTADVMGSFPQIGNSRLHTVLCSVNFCQVIGKNRTHTKLRTVELELHMFTNAWHPLHFCFHFCKNIDSARFGKITINRYPIQTISIGWFQKSALLLLGRAAARRRIPATAYPRGEEPPPRTLVPSNPRTLAERARLRPVWLAHHKDRRCGGHPPPREGGPLQGALIRQDYD